MPGWLAAACSCAASHHARQKCHLQLMLGPAGCSLFVRDSRKVKTQVKDDSANPEWNEEFQFLVHEPDSQQLTGELPSVVHHSLVVSLT